jgi:hypothetical protein
MNQSVLRFLVAASMCIGAGAAQAQRMVVVNGLRLNAEQIAWLEQRSCAPVPDGSYWLDLRTGAWGYAGWPQRQGFVGAACRTPSSAPRRSLSERGMLYRPGELINGR